MLADLLRDLDGRHLALFEALWVVGVTLWVIGERRPPASSMAWILALALLPGLGAPVYFWLGPRRLRRKHIQMAKVKEAYGLELEALLKPQGARTREGQIQRVGARIRGVAPATARALTIYADGDARSEAVLAAIEGATDHVHAEYYIVEPDAAGRRFVEALTAAARRRRPDGGQVEVRLLVDAAGSHRAATLREASFLRPLREAGGEVAFFNPVLTASLGERLANFRTHRKVLVVDGRVGFAGGMNVSDAHSRAALGDLAERDTHLRLEGEAVAGLQAAFLEDWSYANRILLGVANRSLRDRFFPELPPLPEGAPRDVVQVVASGPDQPVNAAEALYLAALAEARQRAWLTTPYFVPTEPLQAALVNAALRGVDVQLLVPEASNSFLVNAASRTYRDALLDAGVRIHAYPAPMVHAKTAVFDDALAIVGSANLDVRSMRLNFELVVAIYGGPAVAGVAALYAVDRARAHPLLARERHDRYPRRLVASAARLLSPIL